MSEKEAKDAFKRERRGKLDQVIGFLKEVKYPIYAAILVFVVLVLTNQITLPAVQLSGNEAVVLITFLMSIAFFYIPAKKVVNWIGGPSLEYIIEVDASTTDPIRITKALKGYTQQELECEAGELHTYQGEQGHIINLVRYLDIENGKYEGQWIGELDDIDLLRALEMVERHRLRGSENQQAGVLAKAMIGDIATQVEEEIFESIHREKADLEAWRDADTVRETFLERLEEFSGEDFREKQEESDSIDLENLVEESTGGSDGEEE